MHWCILSTMENVTLKYEPSLIEHLKKNNPKINFNQTREQPVCHTNPLVCPSFAPMLELASL